MNKNNPFINSAPRIWEFDVDDTLIIWDISAHPETERITVKMEFREAALVVPHVKNVNLLKKLAKIGWYVRVHSGSGVDWAWEVVKALQLQDYVDEVCSKPLGRTDDRPHGDGYAYNAYRHPITGEPS